jgi:hypothetical protein
MKEFTAEARRSAEFAEKNQRKAENRKSRGFPSALFFLFLPHVFLCDLRGSLRLRGEASLLLSIPTNRL